MCGASLALGIVGARSATAMLDTEKRRWLVEELDREVFQKYVGQTFTVKDAEGHSVPLKLAAVKDGLKREKPKNAPIVDTFHLLFQGTTDTSLSQGTYTFENTNMGTCALFMTPMVSRDPSIRNYEVVLSRLVKG